VGFGQFLATEYWPFLFLTNANDYKAPLVLGKIPSARGSCSTAILMALAKALKTLSTM